jgi:hypothetical protein
VTLSQPSKGDLTMQTLSHDTLNKKGKLTQKREKKNAPLQNVQSEDSLNSQSVNHPGLKSEACSLG